ncbi:MAG: hypothetical protein HY069_02200 [Chlamydiia bacterium]|nr:hypothetical protein [Chlamydiia bacterium]
MSSITDVTLEEVERAEQPMEVEVPVKKRLRTDEITQVTTEALEEIEQPSKKQRLETDEITPPPAVADKVSEAVQFSFPSLTPSLMDMIQKSEQLATEKVLSLEAKADLYGKRIDEMMALTAEFNAYHGKDNVEFTDKIKALLQKLKEQGIDLWKDENMKKVSKERITELKALISTQMDKQRTNQSMILSKMNNKTNDLMALLESCKMMNREQSRAGSTFTRNQRVNG